MINLRVERLSNPTELCFCESEMEVPDKGWAIVATDAIDGKAMSEVTTPGKEATTNRLFTSRDLYMTFAEGFSRECGEIFHDGEYVGDARTAEITLADRQPFAELVFAPVPPDA